VIVAVRAVRMMKMSAHQVVHVVAMRNRFVAAARPVFMCGFVGAALVVGRAFGRVLSGHRNGVIVDVAFVGMMHVPVVQVIGVSIVFDGGVAAILAVDVGVPLVFDASTSHSLLLK
jgi:hypothetical protein